MKTSVEKKITLGFLASVLALLGMGWLSYRTTANSVVMEHEVSHTHEVIAMLESGLAILTDAETAQRGYLLTGDGSFLRDSQNAQAQVAGWEKKIREFTADNPAQEQRLGKLEPLISQRLAVLNNRIQLRKEKGLQATVEAVQSREGRKLMEQAWQVIAEMKAAEEQLLAQRERTADTAARINLSVILASSALACAVGLVAIMMVRRDLRNRERIYKELQESRALLQSMLDQVPAIVYLKDMAGRYLFINHRFEQVTGLSREQVAGKTVFELFPKEIAEAAVDHQRKLLVAQHPMEFEETVLYPDGPRPHLAVKFPLRDASGKIYATAGISTDITERKRVEQIQAERDRFFALSLDFLCIASADGYFKRISPAVTDILGWSIEEFLARPFVEFVHPEDRAATLREVEKQVVAGEKVLHFENRYQHKDGSWRVLSWRSIPQPGGLMYATARDVTEQKRAEEEMNRRKKELEAANNELEAFSYSVSHDLRAPLRHIDGFVKLLDKQAGENLDERGRRFLSIIADSARQMGALIDDLLVFSRMGRTELHHSKVASNSLVEQAVDTTKMETNGRRINWKIGALPEVTGDPAMLRQVWVNLIANAVKYTRPRDPAEIEIGCTDSGGNEFIFSVRDNGVGFDMEYVHKLFGVFQRLHHADEFEGTGIGLANVRRIVQRHGGRTWAEGKIEGGAAFFFSLPKTTNEMKG